MAMAVVAAQREVSPSEQRRGHLSLHETVADFTATEPQEAIFDGGESDHIGHIAYVQRIPAVGIDPEASGTVLQHQRCTRLVIGDGSPDPHTLRKII